MISLRFKSLMVGTIGLCLAGCSFIPKLSAPPPPPPPPQPIRSIAIVSIAEPQAEQILNVGSALGSSSDTTLSQPHADNSNIYTQMVAARKVLFVPDLVKTLSASLSASGYRVSYLADQRAFLTADGKSEDLTQVHTDADAVLVIRFTGAGYVSSPVERSYQPWITLSARLIRASNKEDVYFKSFSGGYQMTAESSVSLPSSSRYRYLYFHDLTHSIDESIQGLKDSSNDIAVYLGGDLFQGARAVPLPLPPPDPAAAPASPVAPTAPPAATTQSK